MSSSVRMPPPTWTGMATAWQICRNDLAVVALPQRRVQVDDVQPAGALLLEPHGDRDRVVGVGGLLRGVAAEQAHGPAAAQVDGGDHDHAGGHVLHEVLVDLQPGIARLLGVELGGEHVPRATAAPNVTPCSVTPTVTASSTAGA